jgi:hypothetical protein
MVSHRTACTSPEEAPQGMMGGGNMPMANTRQMMGMMGGRRGRRLILDIIVQYRE